MSSELKELRTIKKLLVLLLKANKVDQREIAKALGVRESTISMMLNPKGNKNGVQEN